MTLEPETLTLTGLAKSITTRPPVTGPDPVLHLWEQARERWLEYAGSAHTAAAYDCARRQFFDWCRRPPWEVTPAHARRWAERLAGQGMASATINQKLAALAGYYDFVISTCVGVDSVGDRLTPFLEGPDPLLFDAGRDRSEVALWPPGRPNPFGPAVVKRGRVCASRINRLTPKDVQAMIDTINLDCLQGRRDFALILLAATSGLAARDILTLRRGDLRKSAISQDCYNAVLHYLDRAGRLETMSDDDFIFTPLQPDLARRLPTVKRLDPGRPIGRGTVNKIVQKYARRAGLDPARVSLNALRHIEKETVHANPR